ncbi:hypothetical protein GCM10022214_50490 [Actinomadura miaoliensis]|uniref:Uncharacterized protein n=1 Tax=Actinomadura miaoliensis TaxID=430685 RepID=A0ABP7WBV0_9ACTN
MDREDDCGEAHERQCQKREHIGACGHLNEQPDDPRAHRRAGRYQEDGDKHRSATQVIAERPGRHGGAAGARGRAARAPW